MLKIPLLAFLLLLFTAPVWAADCPATNSAALAACITSTSGGDTITLTAGVTYEGPFTLATGKTSTVTIRSSAHASLPSNTNRVGNSDRPDMAIIHCGANTNEACFTAGANADSWRLTGLEMRPKPGVTTSNVMYLGLAGATVAAEQPNNIEIDHCYIHSPEAGSARGIYLNTQSSNIHDNYIGTFRVAGQECQAILLGASPGPNEIRNNYLASAGEVILAGGSGYAENVMPANLTLTRNHLESPQRFNPWNPVTFDETDVPSSGNLSCEISADAGSRMVYCDFGTHGLGGANSDALYVIKLTSGPQAGEKRTLFGVSNTAEFTIETPFSAQQDAVTATVYGFWVHKNNFELKMMAGTNNIIEGNVFDGAWKAGQDGYCLTLTTRAQDAGGSPHAVIKNTTIQYNYFRRCGNFLQLLSPDYALPSQPMQNVTIENNVVEYDYQYSLPGSQYGAANARIAEITGAALTGQPQAVGLGLVHNTILSPYLTGALRFAVPSADQDFEQLDISDNIFGGANGIDYLINGSYQGANATTALNAVANGAGNYNYTHNAYGYGASVATHPGTNWSEAAAAFGFSDAANSNYQLVSGDYRAGQSKDATDGTDLGADIDTLAAQIGATSNAFATATIAAVTGTGAASTVPDAPSALTVTRAGCGRIALAWTDNASDETGFVLEFSTNNGGAWSSLTTVATNVTSYAHVSLSKTSSYSYRIRATNAAGASANVTGNATRVPFFKYTWAAGCQ